MIYLYKYSANAFIKSRAYFTIKPFQALDTFNATIVSPVYYVMFTTLTIIASAIMFKV